MKFVFIILILIISLSNCTDKPSNNVKVYNTQELIDKLIQDASKIVIQYNYEIKFGEPEHNPSTTYKSYYKNDSVLILTITKSRFNSKTLIYKRDSKNRLIEVSTLASKLSDGKSVYEYDNSGNLIKNTSYNSKDKPHGKSIFKYDSLNRPTEEFHYDSTGYLWLKEDTNYDLRGNKIKVLQSKNERMVPESKTEIEYRYNNKNLLISEYKKEYGKADGLHWLLILDAYTTYKYSNDGNVEEIYTKSPYTKFRNVSYIDSRKKFTYNMDGKVIEEFKYLKNRGEKEQILFHRIHSYNNQGYEIKREIYGSKGELLSYTEYEYEFPKIYNSVN